MGCGASADGGVKDSTAGTNKDIDQKLMYPSFHVDPNITPEIAETAISSWKAVVDKSLPAYKKYEAEREAEGKPSSPAVFFYDTFYNRLWDVAPETSDLFKKGISAQGPALFGMVSTAIKLLESGEIEALQDALVALAHRHNGYGVKLGHYEIVGRCLIYSLSVLLDGVDKAQQSKIIYAWVEVYSFMMTQMLPVVVAFYREKETAKDAK